MQSHPYVGLRATVKNQQDTSGAVAHVDKDGMVTLLLDDGSHILRHISLLVMDDHAEAAARLKAAQ